MMKDESAGGSLPRPLRLITHRSSFIIPRGVNSCMEAVAIVLGAAALLGGGALFLRSRRGSGGLTNPTTLVLGLSLALLGYHLLAWTLPEQWLPLRVPAGLWPLLVAGLAVAIAGSLVIDALERRRPDSDSPR